MGLSIGLALWRPWVGISYSLGAALAVASFWLLERALWWLSESQRPRRRAETLALTLGKYALMGGGVYLAVRRIAVHPLAFGLGMAIIYLAVVLRLLLELRPKAPRFGREERVSR
ncbi:MAG: hypothetical protein KatS3mg115_0233 [Candidatus Poribacteria bacterium]|nr:MAG: hypothetical protein KatS3mg115_0233 [Candidatus Poribacteria bacterium]